MFWFTDDPYVFWLIAAGCLMCIGVSTLLIYSRLSFILKCLIIPLSFLWLYASIDYSKELLGWPIPTEEISGQLNGYVVYELKGYKLIAILLTVKEGGPRTWAMPFDPDTERGLDAAMKKIAKTGRPIYISNVGEPQQGNGKKKGKGEKGKGKGKGLSTPKVKLEFYDFTDQELIPKDPQ